VILGLRNTGVWSQLLTSSMFGGPTVNLCAFDPRNLLLPTANAKTDNSLVQLLCSVTYPHLPIKVRSTTSDRPGGKGKSHQASHRSGSNPFLGHPDYRNLYQSLLSTLASAGMKSQADLA
jgi:hypothetical protein